MAILFREEEVEKLLTVDDVIDAVERAEIAYSAARAFSNPRERVRLPEGMLHLMAGAHLDEKVIGFKAYTSFGRAVRFRVFLYSAETGALVAIVEGARLGQLRTGAASAVASRRMARPESAVLGILGTGFQAAGQLEAISRVLPIRQVRAYSRREGPRQAFSERMSAELGLEVVPVSAAESACRGADIVVTATPSAEPVLEGAWLEPGTHVCGVGANSLARRELAGSLVRRAARIVVDSRAQAERESGALLFAVERGHLRWEQVHELRDVCAGRVRGRESVEEITLFHSLGSALWDLAAAALVLKRGQAAGVGQELPL